MSNRYAPLPNKPHGEDLPDELEAAFDDSDNEDSVNEQQPLRPTTTHPLQSHSVIPPTPETYDFDADYDYPPPGSPPRPSAVALPNEFGNSNGITTFTVDAAAQRRAGWFKRTAAAVLPTHYVQRLGLAHKVPSGPIGGGNNMDGVFANVTAKPSRMVEVHDGDDIHLVPEDARAEAPPSYAAAQADSVPMYWETTVHAPFSPDSNEVIIDSLPTGSLFAFAVNLLISVAFQYIGFLLTYLLHTSHAARLGSRAGLGITMIQLGFTLRSKVEKAREAPPVLDGEGNIIAPTGWAEGDIDQGQDGGFLKNFPGNSTVDAFGLSRAEEVEYNLSTTEWMSFFLMTIGWFILLTSALGFWRVKRWERGIRGPQRSAPASTDRSDSNLTLFANMEHSFRMPTLSRHDIRRGLGLATRDSDGEYVVHEANAAGRTAAAESGPEPVGSVPGIPPVDARTEYRERAREAMIRDARLREALAATGLI